MAADGWWRPSRWPTGSARRGRSPAPRRAARRLARQIRLIVDLSSPIRCAFEARDERVASFGVSTSVAAMTCSILPSKIDGGRSGRGPRSARRVAARQAGCATAHRRRVDPQIQGDLTVLASPSHASAILASPQRLRLRTTGSPSPPGQLVPLGVSALPAASAGHDRPARPRRTACAGLGQLLDALGTAVRRLPSGHPKVA